jgi:hypothetical protein
VQLARRSTRIVTALSSPRGHAWTLLVVTLTPSPHSPRSSSGPTERWSEGVRGWAQVQLARMDASWLPFDSVRGRIEAHALGDVDAPPRSPRSSEGGVRRRVALAHQLDAGTHRGAAHLGQHLGLDPRVPLAMCYLTNPRSPTRATVEQVPELPMDIRCSGPGATGRGRGARAASSRVANRARVDQRPCWRRCRRGDCVFGVGAVVSRGDGEVLGDQEHHRRRHGGDQ